MSYIHVTEGLYTRDGNVSPEYNNNQKKKEWNFYYHLYVQNDYIFNVKFSQKN